ncbi:hypothetical protein LPE509_03225 [Legionella pneumophila subsp. pneumophila LPE509]|nr:hypothetical protein LPE509_03225 [Legionella pneumophila subsp. pneumophila LPE509]
MCYLAGAKAPGKFLLQQIAVISCGSSRAIFARSVVCWA